MPLMYRPAFVFLLGTVVLLASQASFAEEEQANASASASTLAHTDGELCVEEICSLLHSIDPYLPAGEVKGEIDIFGSTSMDSLAHGWALGFKKFYPEVEVVISAEGSETVFDRLLKNPSSIGMISRPVTMQDLEKLKSEGLEQPVAICVARDALGVFVHKDNPLEAVSYPQLLTLYCSDETPTAATWSDVGVEGELAEKPVQIISRTKVSGTRTFVERFLFHSHQMKPDEQFLDTNSEVIKAISENPQAIGIVDFAFHSEGVKRLHLRNKSVVIEDSDHEVLIGHYPIMRPMTLVFDLSEKSVKATANREFVKYALAQAGQTQAILSGFYPYAPPTLMAEMEKLEGNDKELAVDAESDHEAAK